MTLIKFRKREMEEETSSFYFDYFFFFVVECECNANEWTISRYAIRIWTFFFIQFPTLFPIYELIPGKDTTITWDVTYCSKVHSILFDSWLLCVWKKKRTSFELRYRYISQDVTKMSTNLAVIKVLLGKKKKKVNYQKSRNFFICLRQGWKLTTFHFNVVAERC